MAFNLNYRLSCLKKGPFSIILKTFMVFYKNAFSNLEFFNSHRIHQFIDLPVRIRLQQWNFSQKQLVHFPLCLVVRNHNLSKTSFSTEKIEKVPESRTINVPKSASRECSDSSCSPTVVQKRQFSKNDSTSIRSLIVNNALILKNLFLAFFEIKEENLNFNNKYFLNQAWTFPAART